MARAAPSAFVTVRSEGGLLPPDLLARVAAADAELGGVLPADYGLAAGTRLNDVIAQAWAAAKIYWAAFQTTLARLGEGESSVSETREQWVLPLFRELGYGRLAFQPTAEQVGDRTFPISHRAGVGPGAPPIHIVAATQDLDRGEGRRTVGELRVSPQGLVQDYLNRTDHLWGIVTNGRQLRLLRDNESLTRAAYVEFDLVAMMESGAYSDFVLLYVLLHRSRLPQGTVDTTDCWLEKWRLASVKGGTRALDALRDGVAAAIAALGEGLLAHPANGALQDRLKTGDLSVATYYQQLLRLVYRLLFLLVAEERDLLFTTNVPARLQEIYLQHYSVSRLRPWAERRRRADLHDDLWRSLQRTFIMMRDGQPALGVQPLSGGLFKPDSCPDLDAAQLRNDSLLTAMRGLSLVTVRGVVQRVNYRDLNVEELGSVYESLLDLHPALRVNGGQQAHFELTGGSERKTTGSYYTPSELVTELLKSALDPVIAQALSEGRTVEEKRRNLLSLTVCDPAAGSGHFLLAAARRIGREVARLDAGETEPDIATLRLAVREVITHCIYGVDLNPLAVDLCRLALWIEGHLPGRPLTFLDHRIKRGNSLVGASADLITQGIPGEAYIPVSGDEKGFAAGMKKRNKVDQTGQGNFFDRLESGPTLDAAPSDEEALLAMEIGTVVENDAPTLREKEERYLALRQGEEYARKLALANAWTAAFFWHLVPDKPDPPTTGAIERLRRGELALTPTQWDEISRLTTQHGFFHWALEYPDVFGDNGGFDCVLGNPPWERIKLQEQEFFAARNQAIATAPNAAARKKLIDTLPQSDPPLAMAFAEAKHAAEAQSKFAHDSGRFPLTGVGDVNLYALFAEQFRCLLSQNGRAGLICPTGIATDDSTKAYFGDLSANGTLASLFAFENREALFPAVDSRMSFGLLTITGARMPAGDFAFFCTNTRHLGDKVRRFTLTPEEIALVNPNTRTCPIFRTRVDAELTKAIYRRVPVLVNEAEKADPWGIRFMAMLHMANDSGLFSTQDKLERQGWTLDGNTFYKGDNVYLPLYEGKMVQAFDHRAANVETVLANLKRPGQPRDLSLHDHMDSYCFPKPQYWIDRSEVEKRYPNRGSIIAYKSVTSPTNERTMIAALLPLSGVAHSMNIIVLPLDLPRELDACLLSNLNAIVLDYVAKQKVGGLNLSNFFVRQFPILAPAAYTVADKDYIVPRALELVYTAWDLQPFAHDLGHNGPPFIWDEERRALLRAELDAYFARLYGLTRKQLRYILDPHDLTDRELDDILDPSEDAPDAPRTKAFPGETFRVLKEHEIREYGEYRTKRLVLDAWNRLQSTESSLLVTRI